IKLFAATFLSGAAEAPTEKQQTAFGPVSSPTLNNAPFEGAQKVLSVYAQRILEAIQRDGFYVRVPSGKQFYLYVLQTVDRRDADVGRADPAARYVAHNPAMLGLQPVDRLAASARGDLLRGGSAPPSLWHAPPAAAVVPPPPHDARFRRLHGRPQATRRVRSD